MVKRAPEVEQLVKLFPGAGQWQVRAFSRPHGTVHRLLGMASRFLHSRDGREAGHLRLNKTGFYPGWVLTGKATGQD